MSRAEEPVRYLAETPGEETEARAEGLVPVPDHLGFLEDLLGELAELMYERGQKYGPGNIAEFGDFGAVVRMSDKFARLRQLYVDGKGGDVRDESVEDTLMDIANYAIITLAWRRGLWPGSEGNKPDPTDPLDLRVPSFERVSQFEVGCVCGEVSCDNCVHCGDPRCNHPTREHAFISEEE